MKLTARLWIFLIACLAAAAWLRFDFYPNTYYGDEEIPIAVVAQMQQHHSLDTNWKLGIWRKPADRWAYSYDQYNFSSYNSTLYYLHQLMGADKRHINPAIFNRVSSVIFQLLTLTVIFFSTRFLFGTTVAVAATLFFIVNPLLVVDAHYARPESFLMLITTLAIALHLFAIRQKKSLLLLIVAFLWGVACACKFSVLPIAALAFALSLHLKPTRSALWSLPVFVLGAFVLAPYLLLHPNTTLLGVRSLLQQYLGGTTASTIDFIHPDFLLPKYLFVYFGVLVWSVMIAALFHADPSLRKLSLLGTVVSATYIVFFSFTSFFNESNLSHLAFVWCVLFGLGAQTLVEKFSGTKHFYAVIALLVVALAVPTTFSFMIHQKVYDPDFRQQLQQSITAFETTLAHTNGASAMVDVTATPSALQTLDPNLILRVPWMPRNEYEMLAQQLDGRFVFVTEMPLPLGSLPHSQLQTIHYPAAYRYYRLRPPADRPSP